MVCWFEARPTIYCRMAWYAGMRQGLQFTVEWYGVLACSQAYNLLYDGMVCWHEARPTIYCRMAWYAGMRQSLQFTVGWYGMLV